MAEPPEQSAPLNPSPTANAAAEETATERPVVVEGAAAQPAAGSKDQAPKDSRSAESNGAWGLWVLLSRLVMLSVSISLGWVLGVLVAQVLPASNPNPPVQEVAMRRTSQTWRKLQRLPQWWRGEATDVNDLDLAAQDQAPSPPAAEAPPRLTLSPELQEQVEADLALLQADLTALESRLTDLENSLGEPLSEGPLETRLDNLDRLIRPSAVDQTPAPLPPPNATGTSPEPGAVYQEPAFSLVSDSIVLPSALLFEPGASALTPAGQQLLDTIVPDLQRYPNATLLVGSHTGSEQDPQAARKLTFQQSMAVQRYLAAQLEGTGVHWVTIGYGQTRPRAAGPSPEAQQRNRRVEIGIVPR